MTDTISINAAGASHGNKKKKVAAAAGATALGAGIAAAALSAEPMDEELGQPEEINEEGLQDSANPAPDPSPAPANASRHTAPVQPAHEAVTVAETEIEPIAELPDPADEAVPAEDPVEIDDNVVAVDGEVNPDEIADAIIAEDQIDPNDIEQEDVMEVDEVLTNVDIDGQTVNVAAVHLRDNNEQFFLVDVDNDGVFDVAVDQGGNLENLPLPITVDDAEHSLASDDDYFASNASVVDDSEIEDAIAADMIS